MKKLRGLLAALALSGLGGCLSPTALDSLSLAYNQATADDISRQLLLNIARARYNEPIHFSGISNIAATLNFQASVGMTPALAGGNGGVLLPLLGAEAAENPTISIVPMQGEEFTKRMLTPLPEDKLALLLRQNIDVDLLLRLMGLEFRAVEQGREQVYHNRPRDAADYTLFRRLALHLAAIQDLDALFFEPVSYRKHWELPAGRLTDKGFQELAREYDISLDAPRGVYRLEKTVVGRIVISNYDPALLPEAQRQALCAETESWAANDLLVDVRPGFPGGDYPLHGRIRLRSFSNILYFIGRTLGAEPEPAVDKDPRTPTLSGNPDSTLAISETDAAPADVDISVEYRGKYYAVQAGRNSPWNQSAFRVLWQIFQMTMSELPKGAVPSITIAK